MLPPSILSRGVGWQGVAILISGLFGTGAGSSVSIENAGLLALTRVGNRRVVHIAASFMIFSILGKFRAVFASIPKSVEKLRINRETMISDSITNASATASPTTRDYAKKKRNNKSAKMKQNKLGLRREQWLSQVAVTNKECKEERREKKPVGLCREEDGNIHHESFMESPSSSSMGGTNFSERSRSSSGSSSSCSDNITEEDNADDDGCVDDWEALADALEEEEKEKEKLLHESGQSASSVGGSISDRSNRAWRQDDDLRPQGLPNLAKQLSFPELDKRFSTVSIPSSCPICYEDLDMTDSSFFPCPCGFRLCLFCHKTIFDGDGRCPGCRKPYERNAITTETSLQGGCLTVRLTRSSSMFCRF
ncbi:hypothetical protein N665_0503s0032 [Sinapis alba]|nr:hypothetical protein N665_0503s0032 [Sinapis alba]